MKSPYYLGCPLWSNKAWVGELFTPNAKPADFLRQYASVFNTVEGNTTFYALPKKETVEKWQHETPDAFKFCFKFPQKISHTLRLKNAEQETRNFLERMAPLGDKLGPFFLQLPPTFGGSEFFALVAYLNSLPKTFTYALEVRHHDFFGNVRWKDALVELLAKQGVDRVIFDTRGLHNFIAKEDDYKTRDAQRRKPKVAVRVQAIANQPFVRFIGHPVIEKNERALRQWATALAGWIADGKEPYFFVHASDDFYAPRLGRYFHNIMQQVVPGLPPLPDWPAERQETPEKSQLNLFG